MYYSKESTAVPGKSGTDKETAAELTTLLTQLRAKKNIDPAALNILENKVRQAANAIGVKSGKLQTGPAANKYKACLKEIERLRGSTSDEKTTEESVDEDTDFMNEAFEEIAAYGDEFDETFRKIDMITAYAFTESRIDEEKASLSAEKEEITFEESTELITEAREAASNKMQKSVKAALANAKNYFTKTDKSIDKVIRNDKYQRTIDEAKELCKKNPAVSKLEVEYKDYTDESDKISRAQSELGKIVARGKAKKTLTEADGEAIKSINTNINKKRGNTKPVISKTTLGKAIEALDDVVYTIQNNAKEQTITDKDANTDVSGWEPAAAKRMSDAIAMTKRLDKEMSAVNVRTAVSLKAGIKAAIKKGRKIKSEDSSESKEAAVEESVQLFSSFNVSDEMTKIVAALENTSYDLNSENEEDTDMYESANDIDVNYLIEQATREAGIEYEKDIDVDEMIAEATREAEEYSETYDEVVTEGLISSGIKGAVGAVAKAAGSMVNGGDDEDTEEAVDEDDENEFESATHMDIDAIFNTILYESKSKKSDDDDEDSEEEPEDGEESEEDSDDEDDDKKSKKKKSKKSDDDDEEDSEEAEESYEPYTDFDVDEMIAEAAKEAGVDYDDNSVEYLLRNFDDIFA